jgi:hypothetical protein
LRRWLREPLLHFVLLGAAFFGLEALLRENTVEAGGRPEDDQIVVSPGRIENLIALFAKTWQRAPGPVEVRALLDDHVLEEAYYREGLALGLDANDGIIRRRVRQKMEFVVDDIVELAEPDEAELAAWLAEHPDSYALPARYAFRQVYLSPDRRGESVREDAQRVLAELRSDATARDPRELGDATLLEYEVEDTGADVIERMFGQAFSDELAGLTFEEWSGPLDSVYGMHLVFVHARSAGRLPELSEVRAAVERDWRFAQRELAKKRFNEQLISRYQVKIVWPEDLAVGEAEE